MSQNEDEHAAAAADNNYDEEDSLKVVPLPAAHVHTSDCCMILFLFGVWGPILHCGFRLLGIHKKS